MVSLLNDAGAEYLGGERNSYASAVVEGAMGVFFQADHIVFDLGLPTDDSEVLPDIQTAMHIARAGGAGYMLDLRIGAPEQSTGLPEYLMYEFLDLANGLVLSSGIVQTAEIDTEAPDGFTICLLLGERAASVAVRTLR